MKYIKYIMIFCLIVLLTGCQEKIYELINSEDVFIKSSNLKVYEDIYLKDIITLNNNIELISDNYKIDTDILGKKEYEIVYVKDKKKYSYKYFLNVVDNEAPIVFSGTNKTVTKGYTGELCNLITYGDNYDGNINCVIEGNYNLNKKGSYKLKYILSDSSNNIKEVNVTLNVVDKTNKTNSSSNIILFKDIIKNYKTDSNEIGIDVSKWQGDIDFEKVKNAGAGFVMMRIGYQTKTGELEIDPYFLQNIKNAKASGLKVGIYFASIAISREEVINHANWVINTLNGEKLDLPIAFDWENWSRWNNFKISFHDINSIANDFIKTVKKSGYEGMLYSSKFYLENIWTNKLDFPVWLAHYTTKTSYTGKYKIWQMCNTGRIDGINGDVDIDIIYN